MVRLDMIANVFSHTYKSYFAKKPKEYNYQ